MMNEEMTQKLLRRFNEYVRNNSNIVFRKRNANVHEKKGLTQQDTFTPVNCQNNGNQCTVTGTCEIYFPVNGNDNISFGQTSFNALIQYRMFHSDCEDAPNDIDFEIEEIVNNLIELR